MVYPWVYFLSPRNSIIGIRRRHMKLRGGRFFMGQSGPGLRGGPSMRQQLMGGSESARSVPIFDLQESYVSSERERYKSLGNFPTNVRVVGVDEFDEASFDEQAPLIIRSAVTRASKKWTDEWLLQRFGNVSCWVNLDSRPTIRAFRKNMDLAEYLDILAKSKASDQPPGYLFQPRMELEFEREADLLEDLDVPNAILNLGDDRSWMLFVGPALSGTLPHIHRDAINILARGRKRWAIYVGAHPGETEELL